MKPLFIKKNGTVSKVSGIIMPASYPASRITHESVSVTADGVKTASALLNELSAVLDRTKIGGDSYFIFQRPTYQVFCKCTFKHLTNNSVRFGMFGPADNGTFAGYCFIVSSTSKAFTYASSITPVEISSEVIDSGDKFIIYY